jgi:membrane associated rhomboid family serine protease
MKSEIQNNIHSETFFVLHVLKFILSFPFLIVLSLFSKKARNSISSQTKILKSFFVETKITNILILLNIVAFILEIIIFLYQSNSTNQNFIVDYVLKNQAEINFPNSIFASIFSWFLHADLMHLFLNMVTLYVFGRIVEREFGKNMIWIYFGSGIIASLLTTIIGEYGIGASGAIAGLISVAILIRPFYITYRFFIPLPAILIGWSYIISDFLGILNPVADDNIGHFAHLGGYMVVMLFVFFKFKDRKKLIKGLIINIIFVSLLLIWYFTNKQIFQ